MAFKVFISHSMRKRDLKIVNETVQEAHLRGIHCYIAERDWQFGKSLPSKIENAIDTCDCFVAFWTKGGSHSKFVNQEIGYARRARKHRILVVESGVPVEGFDIDKEHIVLDRRSPLEAINTLNIHLFNLKTGKEAGLAILVGVLILVIFGLIFLLTAGKRKDETSAGSTPQLPAPK